MTFISMVMSVHGGCDIFVVFELLKSDQNYYKQLMAELFDLLGVELMLGAIDDT